jgi:hypothetical protein
VTEAEVPAMRRAELLTETLRIRAGFGACFLELRTW